MKFVIDCVTPGAVPIIRNILDLNGIRRAFLKAEQLTNPLFDVFVISDRMNPKTDHDGMELIMASIKSALRRAKEKADFRTEVSQ